LIKLLQAPIKTYLFCDFISVLGFRFYCVMSTDKFFHGYLSFLGAFSWDKAREITEKNKIIITSYSPQFFNLLLTLCQNEKVYYSLEFLEQKWFLKRDQLRSSYSQLQINFLSAKLTEPSTTSDNGTDNISKHLANFCLLRSKCISIYQNLSKASMSASYDRSCSSVESLLDEISECLQGAFFDSLKINMLDELRALFALLRASFYISIWDFVRSTYNLQKAYSIIAKWKPVFSGKNSGTFRSSLFGFGEKVSNPTSALYNWFEKMYKFLNSKSTFYFYESFSQSLTNDEMKQVLSKMSFDFVNQANLFLRKCDGNYLRLYLRVEKDFSKVSHGYTTLKFVENFNETSEKNFAVVLSLPQIYTSECHDIDLLRKAYSTKSLRFNEKLVLNLNKKSTIFCVLVDNYMSLVISMKGNRSEKETSIQSYLNDTLQKLRPRRVAFNSRN